MAKVEDKNVALNLLIETSWEVCNKIGGIYTVLSTKAKTLHKLYKDKVIFIGPDVWSDETPSPYFIPMPSLLKGWKAKECLPYGVKVRVGRWDIPGKPIAILVSFNMMYAVKDEFYGEMWNRYGVDSLHAYGDYDEACAFSHAAGIVIESLCNHVGTTDKRIIAHFDEWTTGMGLLYTKMSLPTVATIFTTHATSIGRSICGNNKPLYDYLSGYNGDQMAGELNMQSKHSLEKAAAHAADCFTTVSDITATECKQLLDLSPAVVTPNGFEKNFVPAKTKFEAQRKAAREVMFKIASALTGKEFDDDTFIIATSGRCEYRNKGIDVFLDSLNSLRHKTSSPILAMILVPSWTESPRNDLKKASDQKTAKRLENPIITHNLHEGYDDPILGRIRGLGFENNADDNMTVIFVPCYLNGRDGIFNKTYYDIIIGTDATVFPSYYEPWGYTPLESIAFGVPTITTSLSGFGQWIMSSSANDFKHSGVNVIARNDSNYQEVVKSIADSIERLVSSDLSERQEISKAATATASTAEWEYFITHYNDAFAIALDKASQRIK